VAGTVALLAMVVGCGGPAAGVAPVGSAATCNATTTPVAPTTAAPPPATVLPALWGRHWFPALAAAQDGRARATVAVVGDSVGEGLYASDLAETSWVELIRSDLVQRAGDGGSGFQGMARSQTFLEGLPARASEHYLGTPGNAWTQTGTWRTPTWPYGPGYGALVASTPGSTVTIPFTGTDLAIDYADRGSPWTYAVDGGQERRTVPADTDAPSTVRVAGLAAGPHTVRITSQGADGPWLGGIEGADDRGVRLDNYSIAGLESGAWNNADPWRSGQLVGGVRNPADLVIYTLGGNDVLKAVRDVTAAPVAGNPGVPGLGWQTIDAGRLVTGPGIPAGTTVVAVDPETSTATLSHAPTQSAAAVDLTVTAQDVVSTWRRNVEGYLNGLQRSGDGLELAPDIVFVWAPADATPQVESLYGQLKDQARAVAASVGAAFVDVQAATGQPWSDWCEAGRAGNADDPAAAGADGAHPSDAGHRYIADLVLRTITPQ
jgi:lysophospholipase L1-like esterase